MPLVKGGGTAPPAGGGSAPPATPSAMGKASRFEVPKDRDVTEYLFEQGYTDGLPVVPPTEPKVAAMLTGTSKLPSQVLGKVAPNYGVLTVEKAAVAAVMAGCEPRQFRVVLAAAEAILDPAFNIHGMHATTMGATPCLIVNGPVRHQAGLNMKHGALSSGSRANACIGRALKLIIQNVGGAVLGGTESTTLGTPMKFTMCIAEYEEHAKGWKPYHATRGFDPSESSVTAVAVSGGPFQLCDFNSSGRSLLNILADHLAVAYASNMPMINDAVVVLSPEHYNTLTGHGIRSKEQLQQELWRLTSYKYVPRIGSAIATQLRLRLGGGRLADLTSRLIGTVVGLALTVISRITMRGFSFIPKFDSPKSFHIVVAGAPAGKFSAFMPGFGLMRTGPTAGLSRPASRKVEPAPPDMVRSVGPGGSERVLVDPTGELKTEKLTLAPRDGKVTGTVGFLDISKPRGNELLDRVQTRLEEAFPGIKVRRYMKPTFSRPAPETLIAEIVRTCGFVVSALAD
eukprot:Hpha_TRINITY_DN10782_c0_g1::TRINITY_DN10782_c0_g1_i1::g.43743::m.43743